MVSTFGPPSGSQNPPALLNTLLHFSVPVVVGISFFPTFWAARHVLSLISLNVSRPTPKRLMPHALSHSFMYEYPQQSGVAGWSPLHEIVLVSFCWLSFLWVSHFL